MMILAAAIIPHDYFGHVLCLHVADLPNPTDLIYTYREPFFYAEHPDGLCNFYYWTGGGDGYRGAGVVINTVDGPITMRGPGSSRVGLVNAYGLGPCVQSVISVSKSTFDRRHGFIGYTTLALAESIATGLGYRHNRYDDDGDIVYRLEKHP